MNFRKLVYVITKFCFVEFFHVNCDKVSKTSYVLVISHSFDICLSILILGIMVLFGLPFLFSSSPYSLIIEACCSVLEIGCRIAAALAAG